MTSKFLRDISYRPCLKMFKILIMLRTVPEKTLRIQQLGESRVFMPTPHSTCLH